ncbi:MAG: NitT/TauT family transport system substrate-binding protein [Verrucomicrobiales bacterium]|nr:NitT/TauT family transport system substrate-binding protein [Verrucomicrobiales bacterium]
MNRRHFLSLTALTAAGLPSCSPKPVAANAPVRFGHFPNITHVQALVAHQLSRLNKGWYEQRLGVPVEWFTYNAGPSATEAIFGGALDVTYIGPSPVLNAYAKSKGEEIRILAGAANGGSSILTRPGANIKSIADLRGKKIATPQLGNTQDVQLRALLAENGFNITQTGGDATVLPTQNADLLSLFQQGGLDAAWAPEPFATILELEGGALNLLEDRDTNVTMLVSSAAFIKTRPELAKKVAAAHRELTDWIKANPAEARQLLVAELKALTTKEPKAAVVEKALSRTVLTNDVSRPSLEKMVAGAKTAGFIKDFPALDPLLSQLTP